MEKCWRL